MSLAEHNHCKQLPEAINVKGCSSSLPNVIVQLLAVCSVFMHCMQHYCIALALKEKKSLQRQMKTLTSI